MKGWQLIQLIEKRGQFLCDPACLLNMLKMAAIFQRNKSRLAELISHILTYF
jgi:hypothetical protein